MPLDLILLYLYNKIRSKGISYNIGTNDVIGIASRYPDGSNWTSLASYLSFKYKPRTRLTFQSGLRYNIISIKADLTPNIEFYDIPFLNSNINTSALTGTAGLSWEQNEMFSWKLNATTAFRAPNVDDVGKVFDSQPGYVVVPNNHLKPEYAYGGELGLKINFEGYALVDISTYYTYLDNAMTRDSFSINGQSVIDYDGELSNVQAIQNTSKAKIYGIEAGIQLQLSNTLEITSQYSVTKGSQKNNHNIDLPIRHVAPPFGNMHIIWSKNKIILDGFMNYSGGLDYDSISQELSSHLFAVDSNGNPYAPSWYTLNVRTQYQLNENISFVGAIENILNEGYRPFGSGISGPGTNFIFTISYKN